MDYCVSTTSYGGAPVGSKGTPNATNLCSPLVPTTKSPTNPPTKFPTRAPTKSPSKNIGGSPPRFSIYHIVWCAQFFAVNLPHLPTNRQSNLHPTENPFPVAAPFTTPYLHSGSKCLPIREACDVPNQVMLVSQPVDRTKTAYLLDKTKRKTT
jgi:hypothetical protein